MTRQVTSIAPTDTIEAAARRMRDDNIGFLPVCYPDGRVIGILTDRDIVVRLLASNRSAATAVSEVMTSPVVACRPSDELRHAEELMGTHRVSRIVCTDDEHHLVGVLSLSDITRAEDSPHAAQLLRQVSSRETDERPRRH